MSLQVIGWDDRWQELFLAHAARGLVPGRVVAAQKTRYRVATDDDERDAEISGRLRHSVAQPTELPAIGDFVSLSLPSGDGPTMIQSVLPRRTAFLRQAAGRRSDLQVVAANIDVIFVMTALDRDFNLRRIERYLALAFESGAQPVIVASKADLADNLEVMLAEVAAIAGDVPIHAISAPARSGLPQLLQYLAPGRTIGVIGSSGAGKSTLVNALLGRDAQATQSLNAGGRGRHTTTHRELFVRPEGGMVIDTPGMRELQLTAAAEGVQSAFADIDALAAQCRFRDCRHESEPQCAVRDAIDRGELDRKRLVSHRKLLREMQRIEARPPKARKRP